MRSRASAKFSKCFLFLAVGFLIFFSPLVGKAQSNSTVQCSWIMEPGTELVYSGATGRYEMQYVTRSVYKCLPVAAETNTTVTRRRNSASSNVVRNTDGTLRPANGYR